MKKLIIDEDDEFDKKIHKIKGGRYGANLTLDMIFVRYLNCIKEYMTALNEESDITKTEMYKNIKKDFPEYIKKLKGTPSNDQIKALKKAKQPTIEEESSDEFGTEIYI
jgi:hypothetical protein